jgi:hypothetical protein
MANSPSIDTDYLRHILGEIMYQTKAMRAKVISDGRAADRIDRSVSDALDLIGNAPAVRSGVSPPVSETAEAKLAAKLKGVAAGSV